MAAAKRSTKSSMAAASALQAASKKAAAPVEAAPVATEQDASEQSESGSANDDMDEDDEQSDGDDSDNGNDDAQSDTDGEQPASDNEDDALDLDIASQDGDNDDETLDAVGFGDAMSKILGQSVAADAQPILAKRTTQRMREIAADKHVVKTARTSAAEKREKDQRDMVVPSVATAADDRRLRAIATKGVVALFNAIEKHQHQNGKKVDEKSDKKVKEMSKDNFLGLLKAQQHAVANPPATATPAAAGAKSTWSVVQDDYMMGAKLKDWDAAHGTEKGRVRTTDGVEEEAAEDTAWRQVADLDSDHDDASNTTTKKAAARSTKRPSAKSTGATKKPKRA